MKKLLLDKKYKNYIILAAATCFFLLGMVIENKFYLDVCITVVYYAVLSCAWNVMCGYVGEISLGHVAFLGLGQYTCVLLYTKMGLTPWIGMILGSIVAMMLAFVVGILSLRLKGPFFTATLKAFSKKPSGSM